MSRYSLTNECIDVINELDSVSVDSELAVIESMLEVYSKAIMIMENSKHVDVDNFSIFQEASMFFQEGENDTNNGEQNSDTSANKENKTEAKDDKKEEPAKTKEESKEYNKDHHFRQYYTFGKSTGKMEHMAISVLFFIPRLIALPMKLFINWIKKKHDEKNATTVEKATPEQKENAKKGMSNDAGKEMKPGVNVSQDGSSVSGSANNGEITMQTDFDTVTTEDIFNGAQEVIDRFMSDIDKMLSQDLTTNQQTMEKTEGLSEWVKQRVKGVKKSMGWGEYKNKKKECLKNLGAAQNRMNAEIKKANDNIESLKQKLGNTDDQNLTAMIDARKKDVEALKLYVKSISDIMARVNAQDVLYQNQAEYLAGLINQYNKNIEPATNNFNLGNAQIDSNNNTDTQQSQPQPTNEETTNTSGGGDNQ